MSVKGGGALATSQLTGSCDRRSGGESKEIIKRRSALILAMDNVDIVLSILYKRHDLTLNVVLEFGQ